MGGVLVERQRRQSFQVPIGVEFGEGDSPSRVGMRYGEGHCSFPRNFFYLEVVHFGHIFEQVYPT